MQRQSLLIGWSKQFTIAKFFVTCGKMFLFSRSFKSLEIKPLREFFEILQ
jgi:hypothetical protein